MHSATLWRLWHKRILTRKTNVREQSSSNCEKIDPNYTGDHKTRKYHDAGNMPEKERIDLRDKHFTPRMTVMFNIYIASIDIKNLRVPTIGIGIEWSFFECISRWSARRMRHTHSNFFFVITLCFLTRVRVYNWTSNETIRLFLFLRARFHLRCRFRSFSYSWVKARQTETMETFVTEWRVSKPSSSLIITVISFWNFIWDFVFFCLVLTHLMYCLKVFGRICKKQCPKMSVSSNQTLDIWTANKKWFVCCIRKHAMHIFETFFVWISFSWYSLISFNHFSSFTDFILRINDTQTT